MRARPIKTSEVSCWASIVQSPSAASGNPFCLGSGALKCHKLHALEALECPTMFSNQCHIYARYKLPKQLVILVAGKWVDMKVCGHVKGVKRVDTTRAVATPLAC